MASSSPIVGAKAPSRPAATFSTTAARMIFLGPKRLARKPVGSATMMPTKVNIDIDHDAVAASTPNSAMKSVMMVGILYWAMVTAVATRNSTAPTPKALL